jgi:hypothetical protein
MHRRIINSRFHIAMTGDHNNGISGFIFLLLQAIQHHPFSAFLYRTKQDRNRYFLFFITCTPSSASST